MPSRIWSSQGAPAPRQTRRLFSTGPSSTATRATSLRTRSTPSSADARRLHHLLGDGAKRAILRSLALRLKPGAPLILAGNHYAYASQPLMLAAWGRALAHAGRDPGRGQGEARQDPARRRPSPLQGRGRGSARRCGIRAADAFLLEPVLGGLDHATAGQRRPALA